MMFCRVFGRSDAIPDRGALAALLSGLGAEAVFSFDDSGWYAAEITLGPGGPVVMERWQADEEGIRAELNAWAGYFETCDYSPHHAALMERCIQTRQLFVLRKPLDHADEARLARVCAALCAELARLTDGFVQRDREGTFEADGTLLVQEY
jgi:hypothetical protein